MEIQNPPKDELENLAIALASGVIALEKSKKLQSEKAHAQISQSFHKAFEQLDSLSLPELRKRWRELYSSKSVPGYSKKVLIYKLKYRLQELTYGGLTDEAHQLLEEAIDKYILDRTKEEIFDQYPIGTRITRIYQNQSHTVTIMRNGYLYSGTIYKNLTKLSREITGQRYWSGKRFFGLEQ